MYFSLFHKLFLAVYIKIVIWLNTNNNNIKGKNDANKSTKRDNSFVVSASKYHFKVPSSEYEGQYLAPMEDSASEKDMSVAGFTKLHPTFSF